jgi:glycerate kinase
MHRIDAFFPILQSIVTLEEAMKTDIAYINMAKTSEQAMRLFLAGRKSRS